MAIWVQKSFSENCSVGSGGGGGDVAVAVAVAVAVDVAVVDKVLLIFCKVSDDQLFKLKPFFIHFFSWKKNILDTFFQPINNLNFFKSWNQKVSFGSNPLK